MQGLFLIFVIAFAISLVVGLIIYPLLKKMKMGQVVLEYVTEHKEKSGTPTMGGIVFILAILISYIAVVGFNQKFGLVSLAVMVGFGIIGFLDDFIKIKFKRNLGLRAYQKIIPQFMIALICGLFVYFSDNSTQRIPFTDIAIDFGVWIVPLVMFVFLSMVNSVNLTDGLDGLSGGVSVCYLIIFAIMIFAESSILQENGFYIAKEMQSLVFLCLSAIGGVIAFLIFNSHPAKIFMGDTGSMALGGLTACIAIFSGNSLFVPLVGIMFVVSSVSVLIQIVSFKLTKKRVFKMAPYHHHLQQKGLSETKIVSLYMVITLVVGALCLVFLV